MWKLRSVTRGGDEEGCVDYERGNNRKTDDSNTNDSNTNDSSSSSNSSNSNSNIPTPTSSPTER